MVVLSFPFHPAALVRARLDDKPLVRERRDHESTLFFSVLILIAYAPSKYSGTVVVVGRGLALFRNSELYLVYRARSLPLLGLEEHDSQHGELTASCNTWGQK